MPDYFSQASFGVDHYRPQKRFQHLVTNYTNLFYACNTCNSRKKSYWSDAEPFIPNPCEHIMWDHLRFNGPSVQSKSPSGDWTAELLDLNDPQVVGIRETILTTIEALISKMERAKATLMKLEQLLIDAPNPQLRSDIDSLRESIRREEDTLGKITGTAYE